MNKSKKVIDFLEQENKGKQENAEVGPTDEDITHFIFAALSGEVEFAGVKVKAEEMGVRKSPLNIEAEIPAYGKKWRVKARIPWTGLRIESVE